MNTAMTAVPFVVAALLSGCGGAATQYTGAPFSPLTGVFSDAPVTGLDYRTTSGAAGKTDAQGQFNFAYGDAITFSVGGIMLGSVVPIITPAGTATVTPADLALMPATFQTTQLIGQVLGTLNSIAVDRNIATNITATSPQPLASGVFTVPGDVTTLLAPLVELYLFPPYYYPIPLLGLYSFLPSQVLAQLQTIASVEGGVAGVPSAADATLNINQGINAANVIGTVWTATSAAGGGLTGTFYFRPDGNMTGFTSDGNILAGTWAASITPGAPVQFALISAAGVNYAGTINNGVSTATISDSTGTAAYTITKVTVNTLITSNLDQGGWYGVYTPVGSAGVYGAGTPVYLILSPDGTFSGIMDGDQLNTGIIGGTWNAGSYSFNTGLPTSGIGAGKFLNSTGTGTFSFNMALQTGSFSINGNVAGTISFSRTGVLAMNSSTFTSSSAPMSSLLLPVNITWPANPADLHSNFALELSVTGSGGVAASGIKAEVNPLGNGPLGNGAPTYTMADSISVPYPGTAQNYTLSVNQIITGNCNIISGASGVPSTPIPVAITCN